MFNKWECDLNLTYPTFVSQTGFEQPVPNVSVTTTCIIIKICSAK